jgi:hypothetical protein
MIVFKIVKSDFYRTNKTLINDSGKQSYFNRFFSGA